MKKFTYTCFIAFLAAVGTLVALERLTPDAAAGDAELPGYTLDQVARHATLDSCWMVIDGQVYDFTDYIPDHPTPPSVMEPWCGREATEGMRTKGYGRDHSRAAWAMMAPFRIGTLVKE